MKINKVILNAIVVIMVVILSFPMTGIRVDAAEVFIDCGNGKPEGKTFDNLPMILMPGESLTYYEDERKEDILTTVTTDEGVQTIKLGERTTRPGGFLVTEGGGLVATTEGDTLVLRGGKEGNIESFSVVPITSIIAKDVPVLVTAVPLPAGAIDSMQVTNDMGVVTSQDTLRYCAVKVEGLPAAGFDIEYDLDGGSWTTAGRGPGFIKVTKERQEIDSEDPVKLAYTFGGYEVTSGHTGSAIRVRGGDIIVDELKVGSNWESAKTAMNSGTVKLKAEWYPAYYDCSFDANGGTISGGKPSYMTIESYESKFIDVSATKKDDVFVGWVCNGKLIKSEADFKSIFENPSLSDIKFIAKWQSEATPCELGNHDFSAKDVTKATLTTNGKIVTKCSVCGEVSSTKTIYAAKTVKLDTTTYTYDGKVKTPAVIVKDSKGNVISSKYYTVTYPSGRKNVGTYTVVVKGKTRYSFTKKLTFKIYPVKTSISSVTPKSKSFTVTWEKKSAQVTGYQIQYSTSSTFASGNKTVTVSSYKTTSKTIKDLKAKKKYYVRVRTYKTVSGTKYYSAWSTKKAVTTK